MNEETFVELTPLQVFACNVQTVLLKHNGKISLPQFEGAYLKIIGSLLRVTQFGFSTTLSLLQAIPCTVTIENVRHKRKVIQINKKLAGN